MCWFWLFCNANKMSTHYYIIVVAAGSGSRFGGDVPKQFVMLGGRPVLARTIGAFAEALPDAEIVPVLSPGMFGFWQKLCESCGVVSPRPVSGGSTRWESVKNALTVISERHWASFPGEEAVVLVHDGARPLVSADVIRAAARAAMEADGAIPAVEVTDSLRTAAMSDVPSKAVDRSQLRAVQTPQAFRLSVLEKAYQLPYTPRFTDDASVVEAAGFTGIVLTPGSPENLKITNPSDIIVAEAILRAQGKI